MAIATLSNIEKSFGNRVIFNQAGLSIDPDERVGLIGDNGTGKSTLLRVLSGQVPIEAGQVFLADRIKLAYLEQDPKFSPGNTVMDEAELAFAELHDLSGQLRRLEQQMQHSTDDALQKVLDQYQDAQHDFELAGGYAWRHKLEAMLQGVGLPPTTWDQDVASLSGGQRSRLALAKALIGEPDLLLLDEPTNHLDLAAIQWLEEYLAKFPGAVVIISHDRYLLDRLVKRIVWLTGAKLKSYPGNYSAFLEQRALQEVTQQRAYEEQRADIEKQAEYVRRFKAGQRARQAKGREKRLERLLASDEIIAPVAASQKINLKLKSDRRAGDRVLRVKQLAKKFDGPPLWRDVNFHVDRGERIGIIGPNGSGKTTLLEVLQNRLPNDGGEIRWGSNLKVGYYDQRLTDFNPDSTVADETRAGRIVTDGELRAVLALMLFREHDIEKPMRLLSGGERARVAIARLLLDKPNVLLMDEPTNHLDINSCEALERALRDFPGTLICVSHDRYFLDHVVERLLVLQPPSVISFEGNYSAWLTTGVRQPAAPNTPAKPKPAPAKSKSIARKDNSWTRPFGRLSVEDLESQITRAEREISRCQTQLADVNIARDAARTKSLLGEHDELVDKLRALEEEYFSRQSS